MPKGIYNSPNRKGLFQKGHKSFWAEESKLKLSKSITGRKMPPMSLETRKKMSLAKLGKQLSKEHKKNLSLSHLGKPARNKGVKLSKETKRKLSEIAINNPNRIFKDTGIELKIEAELRNRGINYQKQVRMCGIAIVDFFLPDYGIIIQADGCFYHGCPEHGHLNYHQDKTRNENQDKILISNGFNIYRFWEHEINESVESCINKLPIML